MSPRESRVTIDLGSDLAERLRGIARQKNRSVAEVARTLLERGLTNQEREVRIEGVTMGQCEGCSSDAGEPLLAISFVGRGAGAGSTNVCKECYAKKLSTGEWSRSQTP